MRIGWGQALAWRLRRHLLDPVGGPAGSGGGGASAGSAGGAAGSAGGPPGGAGSVGESVEGVVGRLGAVPAQSDAAAELAVRLRRRDSAPGEVAAALADGRIVKTFAFRGATHLVTPEEGGAYLALRAAGRMWERSSWRTHYGLAPADWPDFRAAVRDALADGPLTRDELGAAVTARPRFAHLGFAFGDGSGTLLKPLAWQGDMSFGPPREGRATFQRLDGNPRWAGVPELDEAGPWAVAHYFRAYGPATADRVHYWLGEGLGAGRKRVAAWLAAAELTTVDVDGEPALVLAEDADELAAARPTEAVRLLPGHDQWVLGPGTADARVVPPAHRQAVTRGADLVVAGGVVAGTWTVRGDTLDLTWFAGAPPQDALAAETARLAAVLDRPLTLTIHPA